MTLLEVFQCNMMSLTEFVLQLLYGWDRGLEFHIGHECSSFLFFVCCVGSGFCDELIAHSEESHRVCVIVCDTEASTMRRPKSDLGFCAKKENKVCLLIFTQLLNFWPVYYSYGFRRCCMCPIPAPYGYKIQMPRSNISLAVAWKLKVQYAFC
jgi:hypothetical protein